MKKILPLFLLVFSLSVLAGTPQTAFDSYKLGKLKANCAIFHKLLAEDTIAEHAANAAIFATHTKPSMPNYATLKANFDNQQKLNHQKFDYHKAKADKFEKESLSLMYQSLLQFDEKNLPEINEILGSNRILNGYSQDFKLGYIIASYKMRSEQEIAEGLSYFNKDDMPNPERQDFMTSFKCDE